MKRTLLFIIAILSSSAVSAGPNKEWFKCIISEECVDINFQCSGAVVNRKYIKEAKEHYLLDNIKMNCPNRNGSRDKSIPFKIYCQKNTCKKQGRNPKIALN